MRQKDGARLYTSLQAIFILLFISILASGIFAQTLQQDVRSNDTLHIIQHDARSTTGPAPAPGTFRGYASSMLSAEMVIPDVPAYVYQNGCGPTAAGMIIGYWDGIGFDHLVGGSATTQTQAVNDMISSAGNYVDYCLPIDYYPNVLPDLSEPPPGDEHPDDCVADFMRTSQSVFGMGYGGSYFADVPGAFKGYVQHVAPRYKVTVQNRYWSSILWDTYCNEIDSGRPVFLLVDVDGSGGTDHFITGIGYGDMGGTPMYACYDTFDTEIHWYEFAKMANGQLWGIYGVTTFGLQVDNNIISVPNDYATIQEAINASVSGDTVIVKPGTYHANINFCGKAIILKSEQGPFDTVINGGNPSIPEYGSVVTFDHGEGSYSVLEGFTLTSGMGTRHGGKCELGGGVFCYQSSPTLTNNIIMKNSAYYGGGIFVSSSSFPAIEGNTISENSAHYGGGISMDWSSSPTIVNNAITLNSASWNGGGIFSVGDTSAVISGNFIKGNAACYGGGIACWYLSTAEIVNNLIIENQADFGGGISCSFCSAAITNNTIFTNQAFQHGGGIWGNSTTPTVTNTILWNNTAPIGYQIYGISSALVTFCDVEGGWPGSTNIDVDPLFADPFSDDYHLAFTSPCIDAGDNNAPSLPALDFEGDPRIFPGDGTGLYPVGSPPPTAIVDMGADEYCLLKRHKYFTR